MSQHRSLRSAAKDKKQRSVLGRLERIKLLREKDTWQDGDSVFGLPKVKVTKIKMKKDKPKEAEEKKAAEESPKSAEKESPDTQKNKK